MLTTQRSGFRMSTDLGLAAGLQLSGEQVVAAARPEQTLLSAKRWGKAQDLLRGLRRVCWCGGRPKRPKTTVIPQLAASGLVLRPCKMVKLV